jgi:5'-phosphate synthase pdxT subunit
MRKLYERWNLVAPIKALAARGAPILGTCAGAILLATKIIDGDAPVLSLIDMEVQRNAFGRQLESFETKLTMQSLKPGGGATPLRAVFIRAPEIVRVGPAATVVAQLPDGRIVAARQGNVVGISFHPEIAGETRLHRWVFEQAAQHAQRG